MSQTQTNTIKPDPQEEPPYVSGKVAAGAASVRTEAQVRAGLNKKTAEPEEKRDTPLRAIDDLNMSLGRAKGIVAVIRDGAEVEDTHFDNGELASALAAVCDLHDEGMMRPIGCMSFGKGACDGQNYAQAIAEEGPQSGQH
jgi:hypothetical protein